MRSFLRVSGERNKFLLNSNSGVNFTRGSAFQFDFNAARTPSFVPESPSVTTPAEQQSSGLTYDSFANAVSFDTTGAFKLMTSDEINNSWFGSGAKFTDVNFTGDIMHADIPNVYAKVEKENKEAELKAQEEVKKFQENSDKQMQFILSSFIQALGMLGGGGMGAIANYKFSNSNSEAV